MVEQTLADELAELIEAWLEARPSAAFNLASYVAGAREHILAALRSESTGAGEAEVCGWCEREMIDGSCDLCETSNPAPERTGPTDATDADIAYGKNFIEAVAHYALLASGREQGPPCENCGKPVEAGQVVIPWDDAGEMHANCDRPFDLHVEPCADTPSPVVLLGSPMRQIPLAALAQLPSNRPAKRVGGLARNPNHPNGEQT